MTRWLIIGLVRLLTGTRVHWKGTEPSEHQRIYFANHTSNLDAIVIWSALPGALRLRTRPVAAQDYWRRSALRRYLAGTVFRAVLIERQKVTVASNPMVPMLRALDEGNSLIVFPEGGRQSAGELSEFKSGLFHLAQQRPEVECIPAWLENLHRVLPKGEVLPVPILSSVTMGSPLHFDANEPKTEFLQRARRALEALKPE
jgi:1-acyl-sn-glycerol-3-phosphate acyltransferase